MGTVSMQIKGIAELYPNTKSSSKILHELPIPNFFSGFLRGLNFHSSEANAPYCTQIYAIDAIVFGNIEETSEKVACEEKYVLVCVYENLIDIACCFI